MRRSLPRLFAIALLVVSFALLAVVTVSAQEQMASAGLGTAPALPASLANSILLPSTVNASEAVAPVPPMSQVARYNVPKRPPLLPALYASTALLQVLDAHSTMTALGAGAHEANPLMTGVASNKGALLAVKAGVAGATIYFAEKMWKRNPVGAVAMMIVINSVNAAVVAHNYKVVRSLQ